MAHKENKSMTSLQAAEDKRMLVDQEISADEEALLLSPESTDLESATDDTALHAANFEDTNRAHASSDLPGASSDRASVSSDEDNDAETGEDYTEQLTLLDFQQELADPCMRGENKIILAPTNSGKTYVAMAIAKHHLEDNKILNNRPASSQQRKVIFLVPKVCLAKQQYEKFKHYLPEHECAQMTGQQQAEANQSVPLSFMLPSYSVLVMTPQILVMALEDGSVTLQEISLLIFDECHLTHGGNPGNSVMKHYLRDKIAGKTPLPQVVGLTASVGIGQLKKSKPLDGAVKHIQRLCANLDCTLHTNVEQRAAIEKYAKTKHRVIESVTSRIQDPFSDAIREIMDEIQQRDLDLIETKDIAQKKFPAIGTQQYQQFLVQMENDVTEYSNRRAHMACLQYLKIYNQALMLQEDCEARDALDSITDELERIHTESSVDSTERWLYNTFSQRNKEILTPTAADDKNPKLEKMLDIITARLVGKEDARALIIVQQRSLTKALARFLSDNIVLKQEKLFVDRLVGGGASQEQSGMTTSELTSALEKFRSGKVRIMVATNVAEMGLDISSCSLVINYDRHMDAVSKVQSEGRARAGDALVCTLGQANKQIRATQGLIEQEVKLMTEAVNHIMGRDQRIFREELARLQHEIVSEERKKAFRKEEMKKIKTADVNRFKFLCLKCRAFVCRASDVRLIDDAHHVVVDPEFQSRVVFRESAKNKKKRISEDLSLTHKSVCMKCGLEWGSRGVYRDTHVSFLAKGNFIVVDDDGTKPFRLTQWDQVPFMFLEITQEDLNSLFENSGAFE